MNNSDYQSFLVIDLEFDEIQFNFRQLTLLVTKEVLTDFYHTIAITIIDELTYDDFDLIESHYTLYLIPDFFVVDEKNNIVRVYLLMSTYIAIFNNLIIKIMDRKEYNGNS